MQAIRDQIKKLRVDALYGKKKHFNAADRKSFMSEWLNVPALIINTVLTSVLVSDLQKIDPDTFRWLTASFALCATLLTALATFWKLAKQVEGHRRVANKYLSVAKKCDRLLALAKDNLITSEDLVKQMEVVALLNDEANNEAAAYTTSKSDFQKARKGFKSEEEYLPEELG